VTRPTVSVILPVYNAGEFLRAAVESVLKQSFLDFELIALNDGSTDSSGTLLDQLAQLDPRVRVVHQPNTGLIATLNKGIELSRADLIARMDADDISTPSRLALQVAFMQQHPHVVLLGGSYVLSNEIGLPIRTMRPALDDATLQEQCLSGTQPICHPLAMFRKEAAITVGGYDARYVAAEDLDFFLKLGEVGPMACIADVLLYYRQHENSVSEKKQDTQLANQRLACEAAYERRGLSRTFAPVRAWRPTNPSEQFRFTLDYGWWALQESFKPSARHYAAKALRQKPWSKEAWMLYFKSR
jgi:glycosyltransferase involved in cell wall biosynthesis